MSNVAYYIDFVGDIIPLNVDNYTSFSVDENNYLHSFDDNPSASYTTATGGIQERWSKHGITHRLTGPSFICKKSSGEIWLFRYEIEGKEYAQEEFEVIANRINLLNEL